MATPTHFDSAYNVGDTVYIFTDIGKGQSCQIIGLELRPGFNPLAYVAADDMIYTTNVLAEGGLSNVTRPQGLVFANQAAMSVYVLALP